MKPGVEVCETGCNLDRIYGMRELMARRIRTGILTARRDMADMTGNPGVTEISVGWSGKKRDKPYFDAYSRTIYPHRYGLALTGLFVFIDGRRVKMERWS